MVRSPEVTESLSSGKGRSDFALGCRLRCIINRVICTSSPPPSSFFSSFFSYFSKRFLLDQVQVDGHFLLLLSDARLHPSKKKFSLSPKPPCPLQPQTPLTTSAKLLKRSSPNFILNLPLSPPSSFIPPHDPYAFVADNLSWPIRRRRLIWIRSSTVCWKVSFPNFSLPSSPFSQAPERINKTDGMDCALALPRRSGPRVGAVPGSVKLSPTCSYPPRIPRQSAGETFSK